MEQKSNTNALVAVLLGPIFLLMEKENKDLRFYAFQTTFLILAVIAVNFIISLLGAWFLSGFVSLAASILWIVLLIKAYQGEKYRLPFIGDMAEKYSLK